MHGSASPLLALKKCHAGPNFPASSSSTSLSHVRYSGPIDSLEQLHAYLHTSEQPSREPGRCEHMRIDMLTPLPTLSLSILVCIAMAQPMPQCAVSRADEPGRHEFGHPLPSGSGLTSSVCTADRLPSDWSSLVDLRRDELHVHLRGHGTHERCYRMRGQQLYYARGPQSVRVPVSFWGLLL